MEHFKPATVADVDAILAMMRDYYCEDGYHFCATDARAALLAFIEDASLGCLWVARRNEILIGYFAVTLGFSFEYRGRDAFIDEIFIAEAHRGLGLGHEALAIAENYCRRMDVKALHLEVERHRQPALQLYKHAGFKEHDRFLLTKWIDGEAG